MRIDYHKAAGHATELELLTSGSQQTYTVTFCLDEAWEGLLCTAVFCAGTGGRAVAVPLPPDGKCAIPAEVLEHADLELYAGVRGEQTDGRILNGSWVSLGNIHTGAELGAEMRTPTAPLYAQFVAENARLAQRLEAAVQQNATAAAQAQAAVAQSLTHAEQAAQLVAATQCIATRTPYVGENGNWFVYDAQNASFVDSNYPARGMAGEKGEQGERGDSGLVPSVSVPYAASLSVAANTLTVIAALTGSIAVQLGAAVAGYDNEWAFTLTQGAVAQTVTLPQIAWLLGIAPTFAANTTTQVRLFYVGSTLCGEWITP